MPKQKQTPVKDSSSSDSDSGPDDRTPVKKPKTELKPKPKPASKSKKSSEDENSWEIGRNRFVKLTEFKGKWYINIREYYLADDGDLKPGKKGIMLTMEQWQNFKGSVDEIEEAIKANV